jgi:hypothetical protein
MTEQNDNYVYVYIDPRNFEEFYYGQGKGSRKDAHLKEALLSDTDEDKEKVRRIKAIKKAGQDPIIRVIASGLTQHEALLIEKTLIWRLGRILTNVASGSFADKFRERDTLHLELKGFDYDNGICLLNVGEGPHRSWSDCRKYGFMSAGQGPKYRKIMEEFRPDDIVAAYWSRKSRRGGYVGIGVVQAAAVLVNEFTVNGKSLRDLPLTQPNIFENCNNPNKAERLIAMKWINTVKAEDRKWQVKSKLFSTPSTKASLEKQSLTLQFLESQFDVKFSELRT